LVACGHKLLRFQRELAESGSVFRQEALRGKIVRAAAHIEEVAVCLASEETSPKGLEALALATFQVQTATAADLSTIRRELEASRALSQEILSALVSFSVFSLFSSADLFVAGLENFCR
jgi:hypothetical protein